MAQFLRKDTIGDHTAEPNCMKQTPLYPKRTLAINVAYNRLERELFAHWALFHSGKKIVVTNCEGKAVYFTGGIEFVGSAQEIFWGGFFEPDFKRVIADQIDQTVKDCKCHPELATSALSETAGLLQEFSRKVYKRMAEIDQRIRGKGDPNIVQSRKVEDRIKALNADIEVLTDAARKLLKLSLRRYWFKKSWSSTVFVGLLVGVTVSIAAMCWSGFERFFGFVEYLFG
jgi:hypothetical protein